MLKPLSNDAPRASQAKQYDELGNEVAFDVREDEEQDVKLRETVQLLLAAGYFRARIKGLSAFDKVSRNRQQRWVAQRHLTDPAVVRASAGVQLLIALS